MSDSASCSSPAFCKWAAEIHIAARELIEVPASGRELYAGSNVGERGLPIDAWLAASRAVPRVMRFFARRSSLSRRLGQPKTLLGSRNRCIVLPEERVEPSHLRQDGSSRCGRLALADQLRGSIEASGATVALAGPPPRLRQGEVCLGGAIGVACRNKCGSCLLEQVEPPSIE